MFFQRRSQPVRLTHGDRPIPFRDHQAELAVADASQGVDPPRLGTDHSDKLAKNPTEAALAVLAAQDLIGLDLEQHNGEVMAVARGAADFGVDKVIEVAVAMRARLVSRRANCSAWISLRPMTRAYRPSAT